MTNSIISKVEGEKSIEITNKNSRFYYDKSKPNYVTLQFGSISQDLYIPSGVDTSQGKDLNGSLESFELVDQAQSVQVRFRYKSSLWQEKIYIWEIFNDYFTYHYELIGNCGFIDTVRYFEGTNALGYKEDFYLTKHFNDKKQTPYRSYSTASPASFKYIFNPEPNSHNYQQFRPSELSQISVNSDLDYCGGNFIANPGILCFVAKYEGQCLSLGLAPNQGEYSFSEYEYLGGENWGLNLNYWFSVEVKNKFVTPRIILSLEKDEESTLVRYTKILREITSIKQEEKDIKDWWNGPIFCGWGHQSYMSDLFRIRSPQERQPDTATYYMCTQGNYEQMLKKLVEIDVPWQIFIIDSRWFLNDGTKEIDTGRWPDMKAFVNSVHAMNKKVLLWWNPWGKEGFSPEECIKYSTLKTFGKTNRPGRFAKFGQAADGMKLAPDITLGSVQVKVVDTIKFLLTEIGVDGFKVDHVAATPGIYGLDYPSGSLHICGLEILHYYLKFFYEQVKSIKPDSLIIGQSPNSYYEGYQDMLRLGDIYSRHGDSVIAEVKFRAKMTALATPSCIIDTDGWPMPSIPAMREFVKQQGAIGVPSLYYLTHLDTTGELIPADIFETIRKTWQTQS